MLVRDLRLDCNVVRVERCCYYNRARIVVSLSKSWPLCWVRRGKVRWVRIGRIMNTRRYGTFCNNTGFLSCASCTSIRPAPSSSASQASKTNPPFPTSWISLAKFVQFTSLSTLSCLRQLGHSPFRLSSQSLKHISQASLEQCGHICALVAFFRQTRQVRI